MRLLLDITLPLYLRYFYSIMNFEFSYDKAKTIQALRYHFLSRKEIKAMMVIVNVFAIVAALLFYTKKIRPEPFLMGTCIWILMMISIWYVLPLSIFKKSNTFLESFSILISESEIRLYNDKGFVDWHWKSFAKYFESPHFFHLYFNEKSFFLIPKEFMTEEMKHDFRGILKTKIGE